MLYKLNNLKCSYNCSDTILSVDDLIIMPGQVVVVLGKSGYGKSTLLETLALMNHTIESGDLVFAPPSMSAASFNFNDLWKNKETQLIGHIRAQCFGFIFQQTNLMPNFSVYENIYITKMIQGFSSEECIPETARILKRLGMADIESNRNVTTLSGGQRQRVAFARALISNNDVLFGDEPTGNLDEVNTHELLSFLTEYIHQHEHKCERTAIIVSHNIELAVNYADAIIIIKYDEKRGHGTIRQNDFFTKEISGNDILWSNGKNAFLNRLFVQELKKSFV